MMPIDPTATMMFSEAGEAADVVARQMSANAPLMADLAKQLRAADPQTLFTCARGSSDHAATFAKYLFETRLNLPTLSHAPSISSIYGEPLLHMRGQPFVLVSQSGKSPDLLLSAEAARKAGALVIAFLNDTNAPLAGLADVVVPLHAGPEKSVAATKSYIATLAAFAHLASVWTNDAALTSAVADLPAQLEKAWAADWSSALPTLSTTSSMFTLGRGLTLGIAQEAALKFKETSGIHAEAFSIAEVAHGPMALVKADFPLLVFPPIDRAVAGLDKIIATSVERGAQVIVAGGDFEGATTLPVAPGLDPVIGPIAMVQSFYRLINAVAVARGHDPDHPPLLKKVTETR
jgi:glutamine---fructose-6-phosphate transaminase (isomerizing)